MCFPAWTAIFARASSMHGIVDAVLAHAKRAGLMEAAIAKVKAPASGQ